jgi:hypothetical protein
MHLFILGDASDERENCTEINCGQHGKWNDRNCEFTALPYACEFKGYS